MTPDFTLRQWFARLLSGRPHVRIHPGEYLDRWYLIPRNRFFNVYLHRFLGSDPGRHLHDHPWWNLSIVLKGGYDESRPVGSPYWEYRYEERTEGVVEIATFPLLRLKPHGPGSVVLRKATDSHSLKMLKIPTWTLFITGRKTREWGFWDSQGWMQWEDYYRKYNLPLE